MWWLVQAALSAEPEAGGPAAPEGAAPPEAAQQAPDSAAAQAPAAAAASHRVDAAVSLYLAGETAQARRILQGVLVDGATLPPRVRQDAMAWLGDIQFAEQGIAAAQSALAALLAENPDYPMDPLVHPPEFCEAFERLRADVRTAAPQPRRVPYPWPIAIPFGVGYFLDGRPMTGVAFGSVQLAGLVTSFAIEAQLQHIRADGIPPGDDDAAARYLRLRTGGEVAGALGWSAWVVPLVVESARWSAERRAPAVTGLELSPRSVAVTGRF